jgi:hypothetical protein
MANQKVTALTVTTTMTTDDLFYVVKDAATVPVSRKMTLQSVANMLTSIFSGTYGLSDGWATPIGETWTYASAVTFTVPNDMTARYSKGTKLKLTQTTEKYFYVIASTYGAPNTTVTVTGGSDYTLANAAITNNYYSYAVNPEDFPGWFTYAPTLVGFSADPANPVYRFRLDGKLCTVTIRQGTAGTSNATTLTFTAPIASVNIANMVWGTTYWAATDNGSALTTIGRVWIQANSSSIGCYTNMSTGAWTNANGKAVSFTLQYEI